MFKKTRYLLATSVLILSSVPISPMVEGVSIQDVEKSDDKLNLSEYFGVDYQFLIVHKNMIIELLDKLCDKESDDNKIGNSDFDISYIKDLKDYFDGISVQKTYDKQMVLKKETIGKLHELRDVMLRFSDTPEVLDFKASLLKKYKVWEGNLKSDETRPQVAIGDRAREEARTDQKAKEKEAKVEEEAKAEKEARAEEEAKAEKEARAEEEAKAEEEARAEEEAKAEEEAIAEEEAKAEKETKPKVKAETENQASYSASIEEVVASAPEGLRTDDIFRASAVDNNQAVVRHNEATNTDIVVITDGDKSQTGSIWSTKGYRIDLTKPFHAKMKLYFGDKGTSAADGMAFVLQNDRDKIDADGNSNALGDTGASLGVMGRANSRDFPGINGTDKPWEGAIQNSYAIEFDTHKNKDGLDRNTKEGAVPADFHIAGYYPALVASYKAGNPPALYHSRYTKNFETMNFDEKHHQSDGQWHDFEINYDKTKNDQGETIYALSYTFTDSDGDPHTDTLYEKKGEWAIEGQLKNEFPNESFEINRLGVSEENPYVYWGFTGATGNSGSINAVVFEELPDLGSTAQKQDVKTNDEKEETVNETTDVVQSGDKLFYEYKVDYVPGKQVTNKMHINASLNEFNSLSKESLTEAEKKEIEVSYQTWDNRKVIATSEDYDVTSHKGSLQFDRLGPLGPAENPNYYKNMTIRVPFTIDPTYKVKEPTKVKDNFTVREENYASYGLKSEKKSNVVYTINPIEAELDVAQVTDRKVDLKEDESSPEELTKTEFIRGSIITSGSLDLAGARLKISSKDGALIDQDGQPTMLEANLTANQEEFEVPLADNRLVASKELHYQLFNKAGKLIVETSQTVKDATPPTGELRNVYYTMVGKIPNARNLVKENFSDTNPSISRDQIIIDYKNTDLSEVIDYPWGLQGKDDNHKKRLTVKVSLKDPNGNEKVIKKSMLEVLETGLWIDSKDIDLTSKELLKNAPANPELIENRERVDDKQVKDLLKKEGLKGNYVNFESQEIEDVTNDIQLLNLDKLSYQPGDYTVNATLNKGDLQAQEKSLNLKVKDGSLGIKVEGELVYQPLITTLLNQHYQAKDEVILSVNDQRYAQDGWQLDVSAKQFTKGEKQVSLDQLELLGKSSNGLSSIQHETGFSFTDKANKSLANNNLADEQAKLSIQLQTAKGTSWAKTNEHYETEVIWQLTPDTKELNMLSFGKPKMKE